MEPLQRPITTTAPTFDNTGIERREINLDHAVARAYQEAKPSSGFWKWATSIFSFFGSRKVTQVVERPAVVAQVLPVVESPAQVALRQDIERTNAYLREMEERRNFPPL